MNEPDPLHALAGRCNENSWDFLQSIRGHRLFHAIIEKLKAHEGRIGEEQVAQALLDSDHMRRR
jgi:hypothetical protein